VLREHPTPLSGGTYTAINYPSATYTSANGINGLGEIVVRHDDSAGHTHGFYAVQQVVVPNRFGRIRVPSATPTVSTP
jgi:hypothetical protein